MSSFRVFGFAAIMVAALSLTACTNSKTQWNSKITIEVETPNGVVSGFSVTRETASFTTGALVPGEARGGGVSRAGEAAVVDLGDGKYLFALLPNPDSTQIFFPGQGPQDAAPKMAGLIGQSRQLRARDYPKMSFPMLVTFTDIKNPKTVKEVAPTDLAATFGAGYRLKAVTQEITEEVITAGDIEKVLSWLGQDPEPKLGPATGGTTNIPFYRRVSHGQFLNRR